MTTQVDKAITKYLLKIIICSILLVLIIVPIQRCNYGSKEASLYDYKDAKRIMDTTKEMDVYTFAEEALSDKFLTIYEYSDLIVLERKDKEKIELEKFKETL